MPFKHSYDVIVIGAGTAGIAAAESARALGASVCVVEKARLGGECVNDACIPSKALLRAAKFYRSLADAKRFGVTVGSTSFSFEQTMRYRDKCVEEITGGGAHGETFEQRLKKSDIDVRFGSALFEDVHLISVGGEQIYGKAIVIASGSIDYVPPNVGLEAIPYWTWKDAFSKKRPPKSVAIIGGGPVACEIATFYATFGTRVVLVQQAPRILHRDDAECSIIVEEQMRRAGIEIVTNANIVEIVDGRGGVYGVKVRVNETTSMHAVEQIVLAAGKRFDGSLLGLDALDVQTDELGFIKTTKDQTSSIPHLFFAGDANGGQMFAHTAQLEGLVAGYNAARSALGKRTPKRSVDERVLPRVTFTEPELASVGLTSEEAKKRFGRILVGRCTYSTLHRSITDHEPVGLVKLIAHSKTHKILGGHIVGAHAGEMVHEIALAMHLNATAEKLATMIHAYPTYAEGIRSAAANLKTE